MSYEDVVLQQEKERLAKLAEAEADKQNAEKRRSNDETKPKRTYTRRNPSPNPG